MKMLRNAPGFMLAALLSATAVSAAMADTIQVNANYGGLPINSNPGGIGGMMSLNRTGSDTTRSFVQTPQFMETDSLLVNRSSVGIAAFCLDLLHGNSTAPNTYDVVSLSSASNLTAAKVDAIASLWRQFINPSPGSHLDNAQGPNFQAAQLAIWEIVYENVAALPLNDGPGSESDQTASLIADANSMLNWVASHPDAPKANLVALSAATGNSLVVEAEALVVVPEAANMISLLAIVLTAGVFNLKRYLRR